MPLIFSYLKDRFARKDNIVIFNSVGKTIKNKLNKIIKFNPLLI